MWQSKRKVERDIDVAVGGKEGAVCPSRRGLNIQKPFRYLEASVLHTGQNQRYLADVLNEG